MVNPPQPGMLVNKWLAFVGSSIIMIQGGTAYCFSIYSSELKAHFSLSQTQLQELGFAVNLGSYLAVFAGHVYNTFSDSHRFGPRLVVWMGCLCCFVGYLGLYLCAIGHLAASFWQLLIFCFIAGNSGTWFDTAGLVTNVRNFPRDRGTAVGLLKSFLGLAASIYSSLYLAAFAPRIPPLLLFLATGGPLLCLLASAALNHVPHIEATELHPPAPWLSTKGRFGLLYGVVATVSVYQLAVSVLSFTGHIDRNDRAVVFSGLLLLLAASGVACLRTGSVRSVPAPLPSFLAAPLPGLGLRPSRSSTCAVEHPQDIHTPPRDDHLSLIHRRCERSPRAAQPHPFPSFQPPSPSLDAPLSASARSPPNSSNPACSPSPATSPRHSPDTQPLLAAASGALFAHAVAMAPDAPRHHHQARFRLGAVLPEAAADGRSKAADDREDEALLSLPLLLRNQSTTDAQEAAGEATAAELDAWQAAATPAFWLLFLQFFCGVGAGLAFLNNLPQIVAALGGGRGAHVVFVSVLSVANAVGRLAMGLVPERELHRRATPRTVFVVVAGALATVACLLMANARVGWLYVTALMFGLTFGAHWTLVPAVVSDLFGLKNFASNYSFIQLAPAAGGYLMATVLAGWNYDRQSRLQGSTTSTCDGAVCYRATFLVLAAVCCTSTLGSAYLWLSTRQEYQRISRLMAAVEEVLHEEADSEAKH